MGRNIKINVEFTREQLTDIDCTYASYFNMLEYFDKARELTDLEKSILDIVIKALEEN